jgi:anti-anti-sigma regulatory factor
MLRYMDKFPKIEITPDGTVVKIRYSGHIRAADLQPSLVDAALSARVHPGFTLLVDLSTLESMDRASVAVLGQIMDRINSYGVGTIIRVIADPTKDPASTFFLCSITNAILG